MKPFLAYTSFDGPTYAISERALVNGDWTRTSLRACLRAGLLIDDV